jgi:hypothetical protein
MTVSEAQLRQFRECGWMTIDLPDRDVVVAVREALLQHLRSESVPGLQRLEEYHQHVDGDDRHTEILFDLCQFYWSQQLGTKLIASALPFFQHFIGLDLHIQKYPYLRAVRPGSHNDAVRLHRDTYYGSSPYEIAVFIPFVDLPPESALRFIRGSHAEADTCYPWTAADSSGVTSGSVRHQLGFPYAPKYLDPRLLARAETLPLQFGQAVLFSLSLVHGSGINSTAATRFSTDIRIVNSLAPIAWSHSVHPDYYLPLCSSVVTQQARRYLHANGGSSDPSSTPLTDCGECDESSYAVPLRR